MKYSKYFNLKNLAELCFFAGNLEGGEQECDDTGHPDGPHPPDVPTKPHPGISICVSVYLCVCVFVYR